MLVKEFEREQETVDENILQEHNIEPNYCITEPQLSQDTPLPNHKNQTYSQAIPSSSQATPSSSQETTSHSQCVQKEFINHQTVLIRVMIKYKRIINQI